MKNIFPWADIPEGKNNKRKYKAKCPLCTPTRRNKKDTALSIDLDLGKAYCHHCEAISIRDEQKPEERPWTMPKQDWKNYTELPDGVVKWLEDKRKIPQYVAKDLGLTYEKAWNHKTERIENSLCFNYFEGTQVVNKKYRFNPKAFNQASDGKKILYNINAAIGQKEIYIVEGEMDVAALYTIGIKNVISIKDANNNDEVWKNSEKYLSDVEHFVICTDNDEKGHKAADIFTHRLGKWKCSRVYFENKDANGDLVAGVLEKTIKKRERYAATSLIKASTVKDRFMDLYHNPQLGIENLNPWFMEFNRIFRPMQNQLITVTGIPSHGKSAFVDWYVMLMTMKMGWRASWYSPESGSIEKHLQDMCRAYWCKPMKHDAIGRVTAEEAEAFMGKAEERWFHIKPDQKQGTGWDYLLNAMAEQVYSNAVNVFVIDAHNKVEMKTGDRAEINKSLTMLTNFCQQHNVMIFLVAHPTKMKKNEIGALLEPGSYDISGTADFRNQSHCILVVHRESFEDNISLVRNLKVKDQEAQGQIGEACKFKYVWGRFMPVSMDGDGGQLENINPVSDNEAEANGIISQLDDTDLPSQDKYDPDWDDDDLPF